MKRKSEEDIQKKTNVTQADRETDRKTLRKKSVECIEEMDREKMGKN